MFLFFFFNDTATTEIYTLSLHDALPILNGHSGRPSAGFFVADSSPPARILTPEAVPAPRKCRYHEKDRKSTRLKSSHLVISYAVFCLEKKKEYIALETTT